MDYLFYRRNLTPARGLAAVPAGRDGELWRPTLFQPLHRELPLLPFGVWSLFHFLGVFAGRDYAVLLLRQGGRVVSRLGIFPAHFKFPFMQPGELQLASLWTDPELRGQGLGLAAVQELLRRLEDPSRVVWYMVRAENVPSIRLAEKARFTFWGRGRRRPWLGLRRLGRFFLDPDCS